MKPEAPVILLVEDDPFVREITVMQLRTLGFGVIEVHNGDEAMDWSSRPEAVAPRAVLSDFRMPGSLQGDALLKQLKNRWPDLHCVLMSGYMQGEIAPSDVLRKPFKLDELRDALAPVLPDPSEDPA